MKGQLEKDLLVLRTDRQVLEKGWELFGSSPLKFDFAVTSKTTQLEWVQLLHEISKHPNVKTYERDRLLTPTMFTPDALHDDAFKYLEWHSDKRFRHPIAVRPLNHGTEWVQMCPLIGTADTGIWLCPQAVRTLQLHVIGVRSYTRHGPTLQLSPIKLKVNKAELTLRDVRVLPPALLTSANHRFGIVSTHVVTESDCLAFGNVSIL